MKRADLLDMEKALESAEKVVEEKVEDGAKAALLDIYGPHPGLALVKFWQGVVELCIRITIIVSFWSYQVYVPGADPGGGSGCSSTPLSFQKLINYCYC